jgi:DNA-binding transcriptional MerR regulator
MRPRLSIGDFSRATHLTVKTLRHYHRLGLLVPAAVDPHTGYRGYVPEQIPTAQVIRRLRDLAMPLEEIQKVLTAPDVQTRNDRLAGHLDRLEEELGRTQRAVSGLRDLLTPAAGAAPTLDGGATAIELRAVPAAPAAAVTETVDAAESVSWFQGALGELQGTMSAQNLSPSGPPGGVFADELFTCHRGSATVFVPCDVPPRPTGRVRPATIPAAELAVITHAGPPADVDRAYGALAAYVARHELAVDGPIREYYLVGRRETDDVEAWRTEVGWPVFRTGAR